MKSLNALKFINFIILGILIIYPFNVNYLFDGLPINEFKEITFLLFLAPIVIYFDEKLFINKKFLIFLFFLFFTKFISSLIYEKNTLYADLKIVDKNDKFKKDLNQKNPETYWHNHTFEIKNNLTSNYEFLKSWGSRLDNERKQNISIQLNLVGNIRLKPNEKLNIETNGYLIDNNGFLGNSSKKNSYDFNNIEDEILLIDLSKVEINYKKSEKWYLRFKIINNDKNINPFVFKRFNQFKKKLNNLSYIDNLLIIILFLEIALVSIFIFSIIKILTRYKLLLVPKYNNSILFLNLFGTSIFYLLIKYKIIYDPTYLSPIGFYIFFQFFIYFLFCNLKINRTNKFQNEDNNSRKIFLFIAFPIIVYFIIILYNKLSIINYFPIVPRNADDWSFDMWLARYILLENDTSITKPCLRTAIDLVDNFKISKNLFYFDIKETCSSLDKSTAIYQNQFFYRYYISLIFLIFGFNYFVLIVLNLYLILAIILTTHTVFLKTIKDNKNILFSTIFLICLTVGSFRYIVLKPSSEILATGLIFVSIYFFNKFYEKKLIWYFLASCFISVIAGLTRINLLIVISSLVILIFDKEDFSFINKSKVNWLIKLFKNKFKIIFIYGMFVLSVFFIIALRNFFYAENFTIPNPNTDRLLLEHIRSLPFWLYEIFAATTWPAKPNFTAIVLFVGTIYPFFLFLKNRNMLLENYKFFIILIFTVFSYFLYTAGAYPPRFSINLLPLSSIGIIFLIKNSKLKFLDI